jgi:Trypsin-co-occurring domain 1
VTDQNSPKDVTIEFGVKLSLEGNVVKILKAGAEADLKIKMLWEDIHQ